jgi:hypothetical protein
MFGLSCKLCCDKCFAHFYVLLYYNCDCFYICKDQTKGEINQSTVGIFDPHSGMSGPTSQRASTCSNLYEWWIQPAHVRCPVAQLSI